MRRFDGLRRGALWSVLVLLAATPEKGWAQSGRDTGRAVIGVFPISVEGLGIDPEVAERHTAELHRLIASGSGFLTVPRAAIRRALRGGRGARPGEKTPEQLDKIAEQLEREVRAARKEFEGERAAAELAPDAHEARAAYEVFRAEEQLVLQERAAQAARKRAQEAHRIAEARVQGGACADDACRAAVGLRVGASKVLRPVYSKLPAGSVQPCVLDVSFFDIASGLTDLSLSAKGACDADGLRQAVEEVGAELKRRDEAGYDVYKLDIEAGKAIKNPKTKKRGYVEVHAKAQDDPAEKIELWINGRRAGAMKSGRIRLKVPHGKYIVVIKPLSSLFRTRRFDIEVSDREIRLPNTGHVVLPSVYGAIEFDLVQGPWRLRSGSRPLISKESNQFRPGPVPVQFYLEDEPLGEVRVTIAPSGTTQIRVTQRPKTTKELSGERTFWNWRRWGSLGLAVGAASFGTERLIAAHRAADDRDTALAGLRATSQTAEYQRLRADVVRLDDDRTQRQNLALGLLGAAGAFAVWSAIEWILFEPDPGELVVEGLKVTPISDIGATDEDDDKIPVAPGSPR